MHLKKTAHYLALVLLCDLWMPSGFAQPDTTVRTLTLAEVAVYPGRSASATVVSLNEPIVSAQIRARVTDIPVRVGDQVEAKAPLARLDCADYQLASEFALAKIKALDARITLAMRRVKRTESLRKKQSISEEILDERQADLAVLQAEYRAAKAELDTAKLNESRCLVVSPFRALVVERLSSVGDFADNGHPLVKIIDLEKLEVSAQVFTQDAQYLDAAEKLYFEQGGRRYLLTLRSVLPSINTVTRNQEVRLIFAGDSALPGAAGKLYWQDVRPHVPANLLVKRDGQLGVFTIQEGRAQFIATPNAQAGRASPIELPLLTPLVVEGHLGLKEADQIIIMGDS